MSQSKEIAKLRSELDGLRRELKDVMFVRDHVRKQLDAARRALGTQRETSETIAAWAGQTFGEVLSKISFWERANLELDVVSALDRMVYRLAAIAECDGEDTDADARAQLLRRIDVIDRELSALAQSGSTAIAFVCDQVARAIASSRALED